MRRHHNSTLPKWIVGLLLIGLGIIWLVFNIVPGLGFNWGLFWPVFLLMPGLGFWALWIASKDQKKDAGILVPGTILVGLAILFFFNMFVTVIFKYGVIWAWTSFGYTAVVAAALWTAWIFSDRKDKGLLDSSRILGIISAVIFLTVGTCLFFFTVLPWEMVGKLWPLLVIGAGILVISGPIIGEAFRRKSRIMGKTEKEWKKWGEDFGKRMERLGKDIGKDVEKAAKKKTTD